MGPQTQSPPTRRASTTPPRVLYSLPWRYIIAMWAVLATLFVPWAIWVTVRGFESTQQARDTHEIKQRLDTMADQIHSIEEKVTQLPPDDWRRRIIKLEEWERENRADHADIKTALGRIETLLTKR